MLGANAVIAEIERLFRNRALLEKVATATGPELRESVIGSLNAAAARAADRAGISE